MLVPISNTIIFLHQIWLLKYGRLGSNKLVESVCDYLQLNQKSQKKPYPIPVGGSNDIGTWGYINAVDELMQQLDSSRGDDLSSSDFDFDHVVFATGSGGTVSTRFTLD